MFLNTVSFFIVILDNMKICEDGTESSHIPPIQFLLLLTFHIYMVYLSQLTNIDTFLFTEVRALFMFSPKSFHLMSFSCPRIPSEIPHYVYSSQSLGSSWLWQFLRLCLLFMTLMVFRSFVLLRYFVGFSSIGIFLMMLF